MYMHDNCNNFKRRLMADPIEALVLEGNKTQTKQIFVYVSISSLRSEYCV